MRTSQPCVTRVFRHFLSVYYYKGTVHHCRNTKYSYGVFALLCCLVVYSHDALLLTKKLLSITETQISKCTITEISPMRK